MEFLQLLIIGLGKGCVYGLLALGFVLIYKASEVINFAQGDLMMLGAYSAFTYIVMFGLPYWAGVILAFITMGIFGYLLDMAVIRSVTGESHIAVVILTISLGFVFRTIAIVIWGGEFVVFKAPYASKMLNFHGLVIGVEHIVVIFATALTSLILFLFFRYSNIGIAMKACSQNQLAAYYMGIPVKRVFSMVWAVSAMLAVMAGVLVTPVLSLMYPAMGYMAIKAFAAAIIGGFGSLPGAFLGSLIIGCSEQIAGNYLPAGFQDTIAYVIMFLVLTIWPQGLFAQVYQKKV